jgi:hypothetical protein
VHVFCVIMKNIFMFIFVQSGRRRIDIILIVEACLICVAEYGDGRCSAVLGDVFPYTGSCLTSSLSWD